MATQAILTIDIQSFWHPGTGQGLGSHLDAVTHRGADKLPALPGKTVKGLLRDAVNRWELFGGYEHKPYAESQTPLVERLFGSPPVRKVSLSKDAEEVNDHTQGGLLRFDPACLDPVDRGILTDKPCLINGLYFSHFSTAIDYGSGTAEKNSLRGIEVVVPLRLYAGIEWFGEEDVLANSWIEALAEALPLVRAVGAHRSRGFGRATLTIEEAV